MRPVSFLRLAEVLRLLAAGFGLRELGAEVGYVRLPLAGFGL